jgi:hypothetical protein
VVAIQCGELNSTAGPIGSYDPRYANTAVTLFEVFQDPEVRALLEADRSAFPGPNPLAAAPTVPAPRAAADLVRVSGLP